MKKITQTLFLVDSFDIDLDIIKEFIEDIVDYEVTFQSDNEYVLTCCYKDKSTLCEISFYKRSHDKHADLMFDAMDTISECLPKTTLSYVIEPFEDLNLNVIFSYSEDITKDDTKMELIFELIQCFLDRMFCAIIIDEKGRFLNDEWVEVLFKELPLRNNVYTAIFNENLDFEACLFDFTQENDRNEFLNYTLDS